jgi:glutamine amidotransferase
LTSAQDRVALVVTQPLTDNETWLPLPVGRVVMFADGAYHAA